MAQDISLAEKIARFATSLSYEDLPPSTVHEVKRRLIDTMGCAMGAWTAPPVRIARRLAGFSSSELGATVVGTDHETSPEMAAFANGAMFRYLDYNDTYLSKEPAHPSDNFAATLAIADAFGLDGRALILGTTIAYEVQCRLCDAYSIRKRGWDHVTYGAFSTVAGCGAMLGFDVETMVHALGLAGVPNNAMRQTRVGELSMWKGCAFANASRNGVFATLLAYLGLTGASQVFEGEMGFFKEVCGGDTFTIERFGGPSLDGHQEPFMIDKTYIKKYPAEYHSQSAVDAAEQIVADHGGPLDPEMIEAVTIGTFGASYEIIGGEPEKWRPQSRETADHSLPYITCAALVDGRVTLETYDEARFRDEVLLGVVAKTKVVLDPELDRVYPEGGIPNRVTVELTGGRQFEVRVDAPRGHALNPMSDDEVEEKFHSMADRMLTESGADEALEVMWSLERVAELDDVFSAMVV
jgi:2-methylcitrate dehydratase